MQSRLLECLLGPGEEALFLSGAGVGFFTKVLDRDLAFSLVVVLLLVRSLFLYGGLSSTFFRKFVNGSDGGLRFTPFLTKVIGNL